MEQLKGYGFLLPLLIVKTDWGHRFHLVYSNLSRDLETGAALGATPNLKYIM